MDAINLYMTRIVPQILTPGNAIQAMVAVEESDEEQYFGSAILGWSSAFYLKIVKTGKELK